MLVTRYHANRTVPLTCSKGYSIVLHIPGLQGIQLILETLVTSKAMNTLVKCMLLVTLLAAEEGLRLLMARCGVVETVLRYART